MTTSVPDRNGSGGDAMASPARRRSRRRRSWVLHGLVAAGAVGAVALDRRIRRSVPAQVPAAPFMISVAYYGLLGALETRHPHDRSWAPGRGELLTDAEFAGSSIVAGGAAQAVVERFADRLGPAGEDERVGRLPTAVGAALAVLAFDLVHSRTHHLNHVWGPGWRLHSVHHSPKRLYWFNASRFHVGEAAIELALESLVVTAMGLNRDQHVAYQTVRLMYGQLQHCNIDLDSGPLDHVFSTPDLHRWHHSTVYEEGDTNYGAVVSVWDKVFGTFYRPTDRECPDELGVGRMPDFPRRFGELQRVPLDWSKIRERNAETWDAGRPRSLQRGVEKPLPSPRIATALTRP